MITQDILYSSNTSSHEEQLSILKQYFPNCFTQNGAFLPEKLAEMLNTHGIETQKEYYNLNWLGKSYAKVLRNVSPETFLAENVAHNALPENANSENILIKGDNLEVLKHLKHAYKNQIKMIYIDPPYNTGSDGFVYQDDRQFTPEQLAELGGMDLDEAKRVLEFTAKKSNSHSAWLTFMYPRLYIACELLRDDGVIFISIDDNEQAQLKILCDEVFGEENFVAEIIIDGTPKNDPYIISTSHEYSLVYAKNFNKAKSCDYGTNNPLYEDIISIYKNSLGNYQEIELELKNFYKNKKLSQDNIANYKFADEKGVYRIGPIDDPQNSGPKDLRLNPKTGQFCKVPNRGWSCTLDTWNEWIADNLIDFPDTDDVSPSKKTYIHEDRLDLLRSYIKIQTRKSTTHLKDLFGTEITPFANPKPIELLQNFIANTNDSEAIYLDFFAGSGTFAEAIFRQNIIDFGRRKFLLVQINEKIEIKGTGKAKKIAEAAFYFVKNKLGKSNPTIFDITKARIEKAAAKIKTENPDYSGDLGFKIFQTEPNFQAALDVDFDPAQTEIPDSKNTMLSDEQLHTLLTTWRVYDGCRLPENVQLIDLAGYTAYYCRQHLYLLASGFSSECVKALIEKLDNDKDFIPERIILFGENMDSAMQKELAQAVKTYANKKGLNNLSVLARY